MSKRILYSFAAVGLAALLALALTATIGSAAPAPKEVTRVAVDSPAASNAPRIRARRLISVPFGIAITQELSSLGNQVLMTGHANCWADSQMFDLQVSVAQSTTHAFAEGKTIDNCSGSGAQQQWDAPAHAQQRIMFEEGPARACAQSTEWGNHGTVDEHAWCKDIMLQKSDNGY